MKNNPWHHGNGCQLVPAKNLIFPFITTCAIEATIQFDSNEQVDSTQVFHWALLNACTGLRAPCCGAQAYTGGDTKQLLSARYVANFAKIHYAACLCWPDHLS
ncbi:MAG: hypothetical protein QFF03_08075 [Pseudomonadota bacterium]|nr:hypothetical protein [Pseudomonadota bacterium]